jgi:hypothetical protein
MPSFQNIGGDLFSNPTLQEIPIESVYRPPKGYEWRVIQDPTRSMDDPGLFYGRLFRIFDIHIYPGEKSTWPDGIVFQSIKTGEKLAYVQGKLQKA